MNATAKTKSIADHRRDRHDELSDLAKRLIVCVDFEYRPGMAVLRHHKSDEPEPIRIVATPGDKLLLYVPGYDLQTIGRAEAPIIDLSDPATFGIVMDQFLKGDGSAPEANPFWRAFQWSAESMTPDRLVDAFEYSMYLPF